MMTNWGAPLTGALLVHVVLYALVSAGWQYTPKAVVVKRPPIRATLVQLQPDPVQPPAPAPAPPKPEPPRKEPPPVREIKPTPAPPPPPPKKSPPKPLPAPDRQEQLSALDQALAEERAQQLASQQLQLAAQDQDVAQSFGDRIRLEVQSQWSRPPSARNGDEAQLIIDLVPTGEVIGVTIVAGSGNPAFDRSAELAVRKVGRFTVPDDARLFETYFRKFKLVFRPEDLRR